MSSLSAKLRSGWLTALAFWAVMLSTGPAAAQTATDCKGCGEVTAVRTAEVAGKGSGVGIGVGAVAGGYAGNEIEKRVNTDTQFEVVVRMQSGKTRVFKFSEKPHWEVGDLVKVVNGTLVERDE